MVSLQSYKDMQKEDVFSWADLNFSTLYKIIDARSEDYDKYKSLITAFECALDYFAEADHQYTSSFNVLNMELQKMKDEVEPEALEIYKWDQRFKLISNLVGRINKGKVKFNEFTDHSILIKDIANNINSGIGQNIFITGMPGSGKSESAGKIGLDIVSLTGGNFDFASNYTFDPGKFAEVYNNEELTPPGSVLVFDEAGVSYNSRDWASEGNKLFSKLLQIIRHRAICVIFTAPDLSFIDTQGQKVLHWWFETDKLYKHLGLCYIKPHVVDVIQATGKILFPFPIYDERQLNLIKVRALDKQHRDQYQSIAKAYKDDMARDTEISLKIKKNKTKEEIKYIKLREQGLTQKAIRENHIKMSPNKATRLEGIYKNNYRK